MKLIPLFKIHNNSGNPKRILRGAFKCWPISQNYGLGHQIVCAITDFCGGQVLAMFLRFHIALNQVNKKPQHRGSVYGSAEYEYSLNSRKQNTARWKWRLQGIDLRSCLPGILKRKLPCLLGASKARA